MMKKDKIIKNRIKKALMKFKLENISNHSLKLICVALILGIVISFLDIYLSIILNNNKFVSEIYYFLIIFFLRTCASLSCNYVILKFTLSVEIDLKSQALLLNESNRDNFFKLISFNTAHMAFTGILRILTEFLIILILAGYIAVSNTKLFFISFLYLIIVSLIFIVFMKLSKNVRQDAANEQKIFLNKGSEIVTLSDRAMQHGTINYLKQRIKNLSKKYKKTTINSLFIHQSFKPLFEILILIFATYLYFNNYLLGPIIYIYYRIANGLLIIANNLPISDHYIKQYRSSLK